MVYYNTSCAMHLPLYITQLAGKVQEKTITSTGLCQIFSVDIFQQLSKLIEL